MSWKGYTVLELLSSVAIKAVIAGILLSVFGPAKERAKTAVCISNLRQIGAAMELYRTANGEYPLNTKGWVGFKEFLGGGLLKCPVNGNETTSAHYDLNGALPTWFMGEYEAHRACREARGGDFPLTVDQNHITTRAAVSAKRRFFIVYRAAGGIDTVDLKVLDERMLKQPICPKASRISNL
jgi:type II secretory pathway pseudopilin PulG